MTGFYFQAPTLFEPLATPTDELRDVLHDAKGMVQILARSQKFARWLALEMKKNGLDTSGPFVNEDGWILQTASKRGFVVCDVSAGARGNDALFYMLLSRFDGATEEVGSIVEAILRRSTEITELEVKRD